jgi:hypothetical protein
MTIRMPKEMKRKWITALRSGEYKQGTGALKTDDGRYCCLGVLQMVVSGDVSRLEGRQPAAMPSKAWCAAHGITAYQWRCASPKNYLPVVNDTGHTFTYIADLIEKHVEGY